MNGPIAKKNNNSNPRSETRILIFRSLRASQQKGFPVDGFVECIS